MNEPIVTAARLRWGSLLAALVEENSPAMNNRESPGRGAGKIPDSTKITSQRPHVPNVSIRLFGSSQFTERSMGTAGQPSCRSVAIHGDALWLYGHGLTRTVLPW